MAGPRSIWNGTITFGLVNSAHQGLLGDRVQDRPASTRSMPRTAAGSSTAASAPKDGKEIHYDDVVKGYEVSKGKWVELTNDEIAAAAGSQSKRHRHRSLRARRGDRPRLLRHAPTTSAPATRASHAYALLQRRARAVGRAGVGRFIFHNRERHRRCPRRSATCSPLHTMRFADELVDPGDLELRPRAARSRPSARSRWPRRSSRALHSEFDPHRVRGHLPPGRARC